MSEISDKTRETYRDQRAIIKFYCLRKKSAIKTYEKMKAVYGDVRLFRVTAFSWHTMFSSGRESMKLQHVAHSGYPTMASSEVNVNMVRALIEEDRSITCRKMATIKLL